MFRELITFQIDSHVQHADVGKMRSLLFTLQKVVYIYIYIYIYIYTTEIYLRKKLTAYNTVSQGEWQCYCQLLPLRYRDKHKHLASVDAVWITLTPRDVCYNTRILYARDGQRVPSLVVPFILLPNPAERGKQRESTETPCRQVAGSCCLWILAQCSV